MMPGPFYLSWQFWMSALQFAAIIVLGIYAWWNQRENRISGRFSDMDEQVDERASALATRTMEVERISGDRFHAIDKRIDGSAKNNEMKELNAEIDRRFINHMERLSKLELMASRTETRLEAVPGRADINELHTRVTDVQGQLKEMSGRLLGINHTVDLIQEHLLRGDKR